ncbi:MAG TPA: DUF1223 domain-containing protein [Usitatibacter sp.]|jgi:hypothetical protein|nr:DUF1223 domain-containing protein [Usitatibacter sp.]
MRYAILALLAMASIAAGAAPCTVHSDAHVRALVELYTSEGCSSCPPADHWLSKLAASGDPRVVPLAFHVSYWDYIGWKDRFADPRYTQRQAELAAARGTSMVYTPQVLIAGGDSRKWSDARAVEAALASIAGKPAAARITLTSAPAGSSGIEGTASMELPRAAGDAVLFVALTQDGLSSRVTAGENRGERLEHRAVARGFATQRGASVAFRFTPQPDWDLSRMSLVAFVQDTRTGHVLQALSAPVCR